MKRRYRGIPSWLPWLFSLLLLSLALRVLILVAADPRIQSDTVDYNKLAHEIVTLDFTGDVGNRTPGYPLFLLLTGSDPYAVRAAQVLLGLVTTTGLFLLSWKLTRSHFVSFVAGASYGLSLVQVQYETTVLSETLTTCTLVLTMAALAMACNDGHLHRGKLMVLGALVSAVILTRPAYLFLPLIVLLPLIVRRKPRWERALYYIFPAFIPIIAWCGFNYERLGYFEPTTGTGYNLVNHSGPFIEYASDRYATVRDIYLEARSTYSNLNRNIIWRPGVLEKMMQSTGQSFPELSRTLTNMSIELFVSHPMWYVQSVFASWVQIWNVYRWGWPEMHDGTAELVLAPLWAAQKYIIVAINFLFLVVAAVGVLRYVLWRRPTVNYLGWTMISAVLMASVMHAALETADSRYGVPLQPLTALVVITSAVSLLPRVSARLKHRQLSALPQGR